MTPAQAFRLWVDGSALCGRVSGIQRYTQGLIEALGRGDRCVDVRAFDFFDSRPRKDTLTLPRRRVPSTRQLLRYADRIHAAAPLELLLRTRPAVFLFPDHVTFPVTPLSSSIVVVHDVAHLDMPGHNPGVERWLRRELPRSLRRADVVLAVSSFTANRLAVHFPWLSAPVRLVPGGVDPRFVSAGPSDAERARTALGLPSSYFLFCSTLEPRKNVITALEAHALLPTGVRARVPLVVAGGAGWNDRELRERLARGAAGEVRVLGYVDDDLLPGLYAGARAFLFPSLYEGFGLPPLEAMAAGAPVIAASTSSMPEVVGDAGILLGPRDVDAWTAAMARVADDDEAHAELAAHGRARAARFTWELSAAALLDVLRSLPRRQRRGWP